jgi:AcrR family transcriptional regulator
VSTGTAGPGRRDVLADPARARIAAAMIALVGEHGYAATTIEMVCQTAKAGRAHFDRCFAGKDDCFLSLHDEVAAELCERVTDAAEGTGGWHDRIWAVGWAVVRFLEEDTLRARFLIVEVNGAGGGAQGRRGRMLHALADLIDGGREELEQPGLVSRCTAEIVAGAIYGTLASRLGEGLLERRGEFLPELIYMAVMPYLGSRAAEEELSVQTLH